MGVGVSKGPTPWWQLPEYSKNVPNLESSAPEGYQYDKVKMGYVKTPTAAGKDVYDYTNAATGGLSASLQGLMGSGSGGSGGGSGAITGVGAAGGPVGAGGVNPGAGIAPPDNTASNAASFARAKDQIGQISRASLDSLAGELGAQNMMGGGAQVQGTRDIIQSAAGELGDVTRDQAITDSAQAADFKKLGYQGGITMRGQDIGAQEANARIAIAQQQNEFQRLQLILQAINGARSSAGSLPDNVY